LKNHKFTLYFNDVQDKVYKKQYTHEVLGVIESTKVFVCK